MVGDHDQPAAFHEAFRRAFEEFLQGFHLLVDLDAEGLVDFRQHLVLRVFRQTGCQHLVEFRSGADAFQLAGGRDQPGHLARVVHFSIEPQDLFQGFGVIGVDQVGSGHAGASVHPHVQGRVETEGKAAFRGVELMGGYPQVGQDSVRLFRRSVRMCVIKHIVVDIAEVVMHQDQPRIVRAVGQCVDVTIEGEDTTIAM